jgi:hypothetical protein
LEQAQQTKWDSQEQELLRLQGIIDEMQEPLHSHILVDGEKSREWDVEYWKRFMMSMLRGSPDVVTDIWENAMQYMEACSSAKRDRAWEYPKQTSLLNMRTDGNLVGMICAAIDVAKAKRLLTFFIDET